MPSSAQTPGPTVQLVGRVLNGTGQPLAGALVAAVRDRGPMPTTGVRSGADGRYELAIAPGTYGIQAVLSGFTQHELPSVTVSQTSSTAGPELTLLANNATLSGVVRDAITGLGVGWSLVALGEPGGFDVAEAWADADGAAHATRER